MVSAKFSKSSWLALFVFVLVVFGLGGATAHAESLSQKLGIIQAKFHFESGLEKLAEAMAITVECGKKESPNNTAFIEILKKGENELENFVEALKKELVLHQELANELSAKYKLWMIRKKRYYRGKFAPCDDYIQEGRALAELGIIEITKGSKIMSILEK